MTIDEFLAIRGPVVEWWRDQDFVTVRYRPVGGRSSWRRGYSGKADAQPKQKG